MASPAGGATASIVEEVYLERRSGTNGAARRSYPVTEPGIEPQRSPQEGSQGLVPEMTLPQPQPAMPARSPNTGGLY
jgi:hypothetical protein